MPRRKPMNWNDFRIVLAVAQARSFLGAGKLLQVTHSTVSRRIAALEANLGTSLFRRENSLCVPTPACARLVIAATRIESEIETAEKRAENIESAAEGPVHISSVHWVINEVLLKKAPDLHRNFPGILLRFYGGLSDGPREEATNILSLRFELKQARGEEVVPIASIGYAVYAPADCPDPERLPWASFGGSLPYQWLQDRDVPPEQILITVEDATGVVAAIETGLAKGLIPECLGASNPKLQRLSGPEPEFVRVMRIVGDWQEIASARCQPVIVWMERTFADIGCGFSAHGAPYKSAFNGPVKSGIHERRQGPRRAR